MKKFFFGLLFIALIGGSFVAGSWYNDRKTVEVTDPGARLVKVSSGHMSDVEAGNDSDSPSAFPGTVRINHASCCTGINLLDDSIRRCFDFEDAGFIGRNFSQEAQFSRHSGFFHHSRTDPGLIALLGVEAETGVFMLLYLDLAYEQAKREGRLRSLADLQDAIRYGAVKRLRPKFMTVATTFLGLVPIMWSIGTGSDVMKRIAAPMTGGIFTSFILELLVYPPVYQIWKWHFGLKKKLNDG